MPDFYQGTELWDFNLVDPDNRRPVDFADRADALAGVGQVLSLPARRARPAHRGHDRDLARRRIKLLVTAAGLRLRREWPDVFLSGRYIPLETESAVPAGLVAFARVLDTRVVLVVAPRLVAPLVSEVSPVPLGGDAWQTSRILLPPELAGHTFRDEFTGADIAPASAGQESWLFAGQTFERVPVGLLRNVSVGSR